MIERIREIGSEFWSVPISDEQIDLFPESTQWFLSGRSALQAIIKELKDCHTVAMPAWCCDSMVKPFVDAGIAVNFYPVYFDGGLVQEIRTDSDVLFLMDYFGYTASTPDIRDYNGIVVRDVTHSLFSASYTDADYCFGSLRKWCGVWTGGYAWTRNGQELTAENSDDMAYSVLRKKAMEQKAEYIKGQRQDKGYLNIFEEAEEALERVGIAPAAHRDIRLAQRLDADMIRARRRANAEILIKAFPEWLIFKELSSSDCPMFVPILVPDGCRDSLRHHLIENKIYCPVHWPISEYHKPDKRSALIYENELSLVCDQRYTEHDMYRMVETVKLFMAEA